MGFRAELLLGCHFLSLLMHAGACLLWEARWQSAFKQPFPGSHYPGNLPLLTSTSPNIDRLYYWAALAMVSLERTNYPSRPRTFVISQGPSNSLDGSAGSKWCYPPGGLWYIYMRLPRRVVGGSGQFTWDISFAATSLSLLDPDQVCGAVAPLTTRSAMHVFVSFRFAGPRAR